MLAMKSGIASGQGRGFQDEASLPGHEGNEILGGSSDLYKYPKPVKRTRVNDIKHRKERSQAQERELARSYREAGCEKAKRIAGSGSWGEVVADVDPGEWFLVEAKETRTGKITIDPGWITKVSTQAKQMARPWWALHVWIGEETGPYKKAVVLDEKHFFDLVKRLNDKEDS